MSQHPQSQTNLPPLPGCVGKECRAFTPLPEGTEAAEAQNQHKSEVKVSFPHRPQSQHWERLSEGSRSCCPQPPASTWGALTMRPPGGRCEPPAPAMPWGSSTVHTELQQRDSSTVTYFSQLVWAECS